MPRQSISEILHGASNFPTPQSKAQYLRDKDHPVLRSVLKHTYDPAIEFALPPGKPPYRPSPFVDSQGMLYARAREFYLFIKDGHPTLKPRRREQLFVDFLEAIDPYDAQTICAMVQKDLTPLYEGLTSEVVLMAFPGLWETVSVPKPKNVVEPVQVPKVVVPVQNVVPAVDAKAFVSLYPKMDIEFEEGGSFLAPAAPVETPDLVNTVDTTQEVVVEKKKAGRPAGKVKKG